MLQGHMNIYFARFEVFTALNIQGDILRVMHRVVLW